MSNNAVVFVVDREGRVLDPAEVRRAPMNCAAGSASTGDDAIVVDIGPRLVRISFNPRCVAQPTLDSVLRALRQGHNFSAARNAYCLSVRSDECKASVVEFYPSLALATNRLQFLVDEYRPNAKIRYSQSGLPIGRAPRNQALACVLDIWRQRQAHYDEESLAPVLRGELGGRYWLLEQTPQRRSFYFAEIGPGMTLPDPKYFRQLLGSDISDLPDFSYGRWIADYFDESLQKGQPRYDQVKASIFWPDTGFVERRYRRLLLPWIYANGRRCVLSINRPN